MKAKKQRSRGELQKRAETLPTPKLKGQSLFLASNEQEVRLQLETRPRALADVMRPFSVVRIPPSAASSLASLRVGEEAFGGAAIRAYGVCAGSSSLREGVGSVEISIQPCQCPVGCLWLESVIVPW